jgi:uncharacterized delta-60 repeat protein
MNRKLLERIAVLILGLGLVHCTASTTTTQGPPTAFAMVRLMANGPADNTFGGTGIVVTDIDPPALDFALSVAIQPDNKIVAAGSDGLGGQGKIALVRYNTDGTLDKTGFGTAGTGIVTTTLASPASASEIAIQPADSKILVAALMVTSDTASSTGSSTSITLLRYNTNGSLDTNFGTPVGSGSVNGSIGPGLAGDLCALALQPDGKIVVAGAAQDGKLVLYRYDSAGVLDPNFGTAGIGGMTVTTLGTNSSGTKDRPVAIALQSTGKIVVATRNDDDQVVLRYNTDGQLDTTFGTNGMVITDIGSGAVNYANAVAVQSTGNPLNLDKIVVAGHAFVNSADISIVRYTKDGVLDTTFNTTGIIRQDLGGTDNAFAVVLQDQGGAEPRILVSGNWGDGGFSQTFVLGYKSDGTADTTFGSAGVGQVFVPVVGPSSTASGNAIAIQPGLGIVVAGFD